MDEKRGEINIPTHIFNKKLGSLESIIKYLKEGGFGYSEIAYLINRDQRTVWNSYNNSIKKHPDGFKLKKSIISIPVSILKNRELSVLENITKYLKEKNLSNNEIAMLLNRHNKTIWTAFNRTKQKG